MRRLLPNDPWNRRVLATFFALWVISAIRVPYPQFFAMQHIPTVLAVIALTAAERQMFVDRVGFVLVVAFLVLHLIGARYLYSYVPYDDWAEHVFGFRLTERFSFERNHYDRLVHICFGLLFVYPFARFFQRQLNARGCWPAVLAVCVVMAAGAVYEIAEWAVAMAFAPDWADAYNGQQGDPWDAQRDMALAAVGVIFGVGLDAAWRKSRGNY